MGPINITLLGGMKESTFITELMRRQKKLKKKARPKKLKNTRDQKNNFKALPLTAKTFAAI